MTIDTTTTDAALAVHDFGAAGPGSRPGAPPTQPSPQSPHPHTPGTPRPRVNPDPKSHPVHPLHRPIPAQPIHEGTDPRQPVER